MGTQRRNFTPEFRAEAVRAVIEGSRPIADVAREYGLVAQTLGNWGVPRTREAGCEVAERLSAVLCRRWRIVGPSASPCGGRRQTTSCCVG
jgi:hypothetical protein